MPFEALGPSLRRRDGSLGRCFLIHGPLVQCQQIRFALRCGGGVVSGAVGDHPAVIARDWYFLIVAAKAMCEG